MDPQLRSIITSGALFAASFATSWAASKGLIPSGDQSVIANDLVFAGGAAISAGLLWLKQRQHTPAALIAAVNTANNGVKVVANSSPGIVVNAPITSAAQGKP